MDELQIRRMKRCAESQQGHEFFETEEFKVCLNCQLTIEE